MPAKPSNPTGSPSPWWILLLIPVALPIGWLVGKVEGPASPPPKPAATRAPATAGTPQARAASSTPRPAPARVIRPSNPTVVSQWTDLRTAISESERNGKPVFIDFSADWCGPCQRLKRQVFDNPTHGRALQTAVIPVSIVDRRREEGSNPRDVEELYQRFRVDAFPTLIVFSPRTGRVARTQGFGGAEATLSWITEAANAVR